MLNPVIRQLVENSQRFRTHVCVGLDPDIQKLPYGFDRTVAGVKAFLTEVIRASTGLCIAFKPNISFFEGMGFPGLTMLSELRGICPTDVPWIIDGKRGDIGNTSAMQARFMFDHLGADATTLHPYMGDDSVRPFFEYHDKLNFVLGLTSNSGADTFEKLGMATGGGLWETVIRRCVDWHHEFGNVGLVVGGTQGELGKARAIAGKCPFLIPGVGAQGGAYDQVLPVATGGGHVAVINMSRSILYGTPPGGDFSDGIRAELSKFVNH